MTATITENTVAVALEKLNKAALVELIQTRLAYRPPVSWTAEMCRQALLGQRFPRSAVAKKELREAAARKLGGNVEVPRSWTCTRLVSFVSGTVAAHVPPSSRRPTWHRSRRSWERPRHPSLGNPKT